MSGKEVATTVTNEIVSTTVKQGRELTHADFTYTYFRTNGDSQNNSVICAASVQHGELLVTSFAYCSPKDQFSKKKAHDILVGRFIKGKAMITQSPKVEGRSLAATILGEYNKHIADGMKAIGGVPVPGWVFRSPMMAGSAKKAKALTAE